MPSTAWHVHLVEVTNLTTSRTWSFPCDRWLGRQKGHTSVELFPAGHSKCQQSPMTEYQVGLLRLSSIVNNCLVSSELFTIDRPKSWRLSMINHQVCVCIHTFQLGRSSGCQVCLCKAALMGSSSFVCKNLSSRHADQPCSAYTLQS